MDDLRIVYDRLRSPGNRLYLAVIVVLVAMTGIVGCLVAYQFIRGTQAATPQLVLAPNALATMTAGPTLTAPALVFSETSTVAAPQPKVIKAATAKVKPTARAKAADGESCNYSSLSLNQTLPPVPSGSWSPIEHYVCDNGYWEIGTADVVNRKTGGWGSDGVAEKILLKYDSNGNIVDRIFIDPDGNEFAGPKN
jgi:hypothetical protein